MKRFLTIALLSMLAGMASAADLSGARWYTIKVANGGYLSTKSDYLDGTYLTLSNTAEDTSDNGLWTYIGNDTEGYAFYNKARGENYVIGLMGNEANGRARMVAETATMSVTKFDIGKNGDGFWIKDHGSEHKFWNKRGNYLAYWDNAAGSSDTGSRFLFTIQGVPDFFSSDGQEDKYYYITFANSSLVLQDMGAARNVTTQSRKYGEESQLWKLVGSETGFQLVNKGSGRYAYYDGSRIKTRQTADDKGFTIELTTNTNYIGKFEVSWNGAASQNLRYLNQWGGTGAGKEIGLWQAADGNNILYPVAEADVQPTEFCVGQKGTRPTDIHDFSLWYDTPATATGVSDTWMEYALPMGNGQIGATIRGGVLCDDIQFNEKTLWSGYNTNGSSVGQGYFQNFGSILVEDKSGTFSAVASDNKAIENYSRYLDIIDGVAGVNFQSADGTTSFHRRYFTSATDHVFVAHYEAIGNEPLALNVSYAPDGQIGAGKVTYKTEDDGTASASFKGKLQIVSYNTGLKVKTDGTTSITATGISVSGATWMDIVMAAATDYDGSKASCVSGQTATELASTVSTRIDDALQKGYTSLLSDHKAAHSALMNRVSLQLGGSSTKTTEDLIKFYNASAQNKQSSDGLFLEALYFQYGRYFTIGANLDTSIHAPSNLQGIWNDRSNTSFWHCDIHADINVQMNYWPADPTNLSEMHLPFLNHILDFGAPGSNSPWYQLARKIRSGSQGWTVAVENNIFGGTSTWSNGSMKTLGAWYCTHLWRYYKYTMDREFLKKALPVMYENALFTKSIATKDSKGLYEITNEWSPEHGPGDVTAFAQQTSYEALDELMKGHAELGDESPLTASQIAAIQDLYDNFDKGLWTETYNGKAYISEWKNNALSDQGHRHLSHLMCLYPFSQVSAFDQSTEGKRLFQAAYNGQIARNGDVTGWSMGWQTNTYSRCLDGDRARNNLSLALRHSGSYVIEMGNYGGCYYNLFDAHSPFQIDGNYGCTSGIAEMLLQSYDDIVTLLPALPSAWKEGSVTGLKAQGNFTVDETWQDGKATHIAITSGAGQPLRIRYAKLKEVSYTFRLNGECIAPIADGDVYTIPNVKAGDVVTIDFDNTTGLNDAKGLKDLKDPKNLIFNLAGQQIAKSTMPRKGVLVQKGKKFVIK
ncbi:MAG: glycoside hydrolase N-terminal domain-containing protein [Bacteroidaceae bacterium]|nr:glycoside hydrolase N-terminal domain-containing protein [Bacteroidaceae bacterium]